MRYRKYSDREIRRILRDNGFVPKRQTGSHVIYTNKEGKHMTMRCNNCNKMVMRRMIKEYSLVVNEKY